MQETFILGGYTKRDNQGISSLQFDPTTGQLSSPTLIDQVNGPTYVCLNQAKTLLFALAKGHDQAGVVAYQRQEGHWKKLAECYDTAGTGCHLCYHEASRTLYVANYHEGALNSYRFTKDHQLESLQRIERTGSSINPNQTSSHLHYVGLDRTNQVLYVCDLGADLVISYQIDETGWLTIGSELALQPGAGPRHLVNHPQLHELYVIGELDATITLIEEGKGGILFAEAEIPMLTPELTDQAAAAAIKVSQDGRFLYASIRGQNLIIVYAIDADGKLHQVQAIDSGGQTPRDFVLDASETYLLVAHQDSDYITLFKRHPASGMLEFISAECYAPECVCIQPA